MTDLERLQAYDEELSKVMPPDFKDWHQNSKDERPEIARWVIENLRKDRDSYESMIIKLSSHCAKQAEKIKELEKEVESYVEELAGEDL
jgi:hypothetical protein